MDRSKLSVLLVTDSTGSIIAQDLELLYPERVTVLDFTKEAHKLKVLQKHTQVVTAVHDGANLGKLDYGAVREYAEQGGQVVSCLFEYAQDAGLAFSKTHVRDRIEPAIRIMRECEVTQGFTVGDTIWWYGAVSGAADQAYVNQMIQRQIMNPVEDAKLTILGRSTVNNGAVMLEEKVGRGRILAIDLMSLNKPWYNSHGCTNKWLFVGNFIGGSVRYGKHYPSKLSYDEFVAWMHETADAHPDMSVVAEGPCSDGRQMYTLRIGKPSNPTVYYGGAVHGWEWENCYGLVRLAELICEAPKVEGMATRKLHWVIMPVQNPYGFDQFLRQNADGVDLNRNFDHAWEQYPMPQDVAMPWDYNYKGSRAASARETQIIQGLIDEFRPVGCVDFHTAHYVMLVPHKYNKRLVDAIHKDIQDRLRDRYLCQRPYGGDYQQVNMDPRGEDRDSPYLISYAAKRGCAAPILIEMSGNRDDMHGMVMTTDTVVEICLAVADRCLRYVAASKRRRSKSKKR